MADVHEKRVSEESLGSSYKAPHTKRKRFPTTDYVLKKRQPFGPEKKGENDIFVTRKTNFKAQLKKCEKLLNDGASEIIIHGLGAAIYRACNLGLQLKQIYHNSIDLDIKTSTVSIVDDFEPLTDDRDYQTSTRQNSSIHIRVFRKISIGSLRYPE